MLNDSSKVCSSVLAVWTFERVRGDAMFFEILWVQKFFSTVCAFELVCRRVVLQQEDWAAESFLAFCTVEYMLQGMVFFQTILALERFETFLADELVCLFLVCQLELGALESQETVLASANMGCIIVGCLLNSSVKFLRTFNTFETVGLLKVLLQCGLVAE